MGARDLTRVLSVNSKYSYFVSYLPSLKTVCHLGKIILYEIEILQWRDPKWEMNTDEKMMKKEKLRSGAHVLSYAKQSR